MQEPPSWKSLMAPGLSTVTKSFYDISPFCGVFKPFPQGFPKKSFPTALELLLSLQRRILNLWAFQIICSHWELTPLNSLSIYLNESLGVR